MALPGFLDDFKKTSLLYFLYLYERVKKPFVCQVNIAEKLFDAVTQAGFDISLDDFDVRFLKPFFDFRNALCS